MEKNWGCKFSPYADALLKQLTTLVDEEVQRQKEIGMMEVVNKK